MALHLLMWVLAFSLPLMFMCEESDDVTHGFNGRQLTHSPGHIVCPAGYIDHTQGRGFEWECGKGCPGARHWADLYCGCACVGPSQCVAKVDDDDCVTNGELENLKTHQGIPLRINHGRVEALHKPSAQQAPGDTRLDQLTREAADRAKQSNHPNGQFLQRFPSTTTPPESSPDDDAVMETVIILSCVGLVLMLACGALLFCSKELLFAGDHEPSTPKIYPTPAPEHLCFSREVQSNPIPPLPNLLERKVQPKRAWPEGKDEDGFSNVSTRSPWSPQPSARSQPFSQQPSINSSISIVQAPIPGQAYESLRPSSRRSNYSPRPSARSSSQPSARSSQASPRPTPRSSSHSPRPSARSAASRHDGRQEQPGHTKHGPSLLPPIPTAAFSTSR